MRQARQSPRPVCSANVPRRLVPGLYDAVVDQAMEALLAQEPTEGVFHERLERDREAAALSLARLVHDRTLATLRGVGATDAASAVDRQVTVTNALLDRLHEISAQTTLPEDRVAQPPRRLLALVPRGSKFSVGALGTIESPVRPEVPLGVSDLMVNGRHDLRLGTELVRELASADTVDLLCSFLKYSGLRVVEDALTSFFARQGRMRVLTTAYMGATERRALDEIARLGAEVRVSYDVEHTRLHAKAWLFHRESGHSTAYVGSSNLSRAAMLDGLEWNVRLSRADNATILEKFKRVFDHYWSEAGFEPYDPERDGPRFDETVRRQAIDRNRLLLSIHVEPKPHQAEALEQLRAERARGHHQNLVVAATGTGKTFIAAFDYRELSKELGRRPSLLFVAHRHEILEQSLQVFRIVLGDPVFGERLGSGELPRRGEHVFANVQSLYEDRLDALPNDAFDVVVVDEFHHAAAPTYETLLRHLRPRELVGLTATPERADGRSVLPWFGDRIAVELRLWKALDQGLLSPFQYFGVSDGTSLSGLRWTPTGYDRAELRNVYTANDFWIAGVLREVRRRITDPAAMRALGFCVDIEHAEFVAQKFTAAGLSSVALSQRTPMRERAEALDRLQRGDLRAVFSVDLLNEGVDVPDVDTVLFLRPTESASLFLQQLGRGLRRRPDKACLTVLDFIGGAHRRFRFDARFRAIVGGTRASIIREVERGFPHLPSGCAIQLDRVAQQRVLENIREGLGRGDERLVEDLRAIGDVSLPDFLRAADLEVEDVYARPGWSFTRLRRKAGFVTPTPFDGEIEETFEKQLARMLHVDDGRRLDAFRSVLRGESSSAHPELVTMLLPLLGAVKRPVVELPAVLEDLRRCPAIHAELLALLEHLDDRRRVTHPLSGRRSPIPLEVHGTYALDEVMAALGEHDREGRIRRLREGVFHSARHRADLLFVTLEKSEAEYSPTTMYRDYAISRTRFHWESQSAVHDGTKTGERYVKHAQLDHAILLFVRERRKTRTDITMPYSFLGACRYVRHEGARPMAIEWELERPMPAAMFQEVKVAAG